MLAVFWVTGWKVVLLFGFGVSLISGLYLRQWTEDITVEADYVSTKPQSDSGSAFANPRVQAVASLEELLAASKCLDLTVDSALSYLQELDDGSEEPNTLRLAVHRLTDAMTDHLATATSTLLEMVDRKELGVLGDMYDIPVVASFFYPRQKHHSTERSNGNSYSSEEGPPATALPPRRLSLTTAPSPLKTLSLPMSTSTSLPNRFKRAKHATHMSLSGLPPDDRYTSLPPRTPRGSKRSSWAPEWNDRIKHDASTDRREFSDGEDRLSPAPRRLPVGQVKTGGLPATPQIPPFTPRKSSPLSQTDSPDMSDGPRRHIFPIIPPTPGQQPLMPSPMMKSPIRPDSKRRSLQSMPYFRSDRSDLVTPGRASMSGGTDLSRTPSLQYSDLQILRDQSTHGSRRSSISAANVFAPSSLPLMAALGLPAERPRPQRGNSLNPLTTPGLRAACLGVHLKRRRMACCLLGLMFGDDEEYWSTVKEILDDLVGGIKRETADLDTALGSAKVIQSSARGRLDTALPPPWIRKESKAGEIQDFAPRTSDQVTLGQHIESMQAHLHHAWNHLQKVQAGFQGATDLCERWTDVRGDLGHLIREWERGREVVSRLDPPQHREREKSGSDVDDTPPLPPFMQAWTGHDDPSQPSHAAIETLEAGAAGIDLGTMDNVTVTLLDGETLPPPGQDTIFESLPVPGGGSIERSKLSRAERIQLMKEARDKGMTLSEMLGHREQVEDPGTRKAIAMSGEVVGELKGMIGMIRRRKGLEEDGGEAGSKQGQPQSLSGTDSSPSRRIAPPAGLAEELKRAFVFPTPARVNGHDSH